jgi:hypothetical protein
LELAAIVHALRKWTHYLMGKRFERRTDHNGLKYLFDHPTLNARQSRWLEFLSEYDFDINNIKGVNVYAIIIVLCISIDKSIIRTRSLRNTHSQETQHLSWETL